MIFVCSCMHYGRPFLHRRIQKEPSHIKQRQGTWGHSVRQADDLGGVLLWHCDTVTMCHNVHWWVANSINQWFICMKPMVCWLIGYLLIDLLRPSCQSAPSSCCVDWFYSIKDKYLFAQAVLFASTISPLHPSLSLALSSSITWLHRWSWSGSWQLLWWSLIIAVLMIRPGSALHACTGSPSPRDRCKTEIVIIIII